MDLTNLLIVKKFLGGSGSSESEILESYLDQWALYANKKLEVAELPNITRLPDHAFDGQTKLVNITIPDSVTSIGSWAFEGCKSLQSVTIGNGVTSIGYSAFSGCSNLITINVPWSEGAVSGAPWDATNATINYNYTGE